MGKSPGKWIKTVLFGKKSSKASLFKNATAERRTAAPTVSDLLEENLEYEKGTTATLPCETDNLAIDESLDLQGIVGSDAEQIRRQDQAATKAQAAFRGYMARRAFLALKGIIRLQALIRGHLVRRQAVATFHCMQSIVKLQALARGRRARLADPGHKVIVKRTTGELQDAKEVAIFGRYSSLGSEKLATNAFVCKLLASLPTAMPLSLQYDASEPNSAWNWLQRWSSSSFSKPQSQIKRTSDAKTQETQSRRKNFETEAGESKRSIRKVDTAAKGDSYTSVSSEQSKPKTKPRKFTSHQTESAEEQPQNELERVKRNLRKVSASMAIASEKSEKEIDKQHQSPKAVSSSTAPNVFNREIVNSPPKMANLDIEIYKSALTETPLEPLTMDESVDMMNANHPAVELHSLEDGNMEKFSSKEENRSKEKVKTGRRKSLPAKQEHEENASQNTPSLPSYMAATESAKAKLRAQGSAKSEDSTGNGLERRHSLPAATNSKLSSLSPQMQRQVQANGKAGNKKNRSPMPSKDDKVLQPGWRR